MPDIDHDLADALRARGAQMDPAATQRVMRRLGQDPAAGNGRARGRWYLGAFAAGSLAAGVAVAGILATNGGGSSPDAPLAADEPRLLSLRPDDSVVRFDGPCVGADKVIRAEVQTLDTVLPLLPHAPLASPVNLTDMWTCMSSAVLMQFSSNVTVTLEPGWGTLADVEAKWRDMAAEDGLSSVETIQDQPALVQPVTEAHPLGQVMFVLGDTLVRVTADGTIPVEDLVTVAASVR